MMYKTIKFESFNLRSFSVVGKLAINSNGETSFSFEFFPKPHVGILTQSFVLSQREIESLTNYRDRCIEDFGFHSKRD